LADSGLGSRREIEGWIAEGRVQVNGKLAKLGDKVSPPPTRSASTASR
jgi:23S rRNA pseudouridine2605 synthase